MNWPSSLVWEHPVGTSPTAQQHAVGRVVSGLASWYLHMVSSCSAKSRQQSLFFHFPRSPYDFTDFYHYCLFSRLKSRSRSVVTQQELSTHFITCSPTRCSRVSDDVMSQTKFQLYGQISSVRKSFSNPGRTFLQTSCQLWLFCGNYKFGITQKKHLSAWLHALSSAGTRSRNMRIFQTNTGRRTGRWDLATTLCMEKTRNI